MKSTINISETVLKRLSKVEQPCLGKLYGSFFEGTCTVIGLQVDIEDGINLVYSYPAEVDFCGVFQVNNEAIDYDIIREYVHDVDVTDKPLFILCKLGTPNEIYVNIISNEQIEKTKYNAISEQDVYSQFVHIRVRGELPLKCGIDKKSIEETFLKITRHMATGAITFRIPKTNVFLFGNETENGIIGIKGLPTVIDMCEESIDTVEGISKKKKAQSFNLDILDANMLRRVTKDLHNSPMDHAPLCILDKKPLRALETMIFIDSLAMIHHNTKVVDLYEVLLECVIRYIRLYEKILLSHVTKIEDFTNISRLETFHFYIHECGHFLTRLYPKSVTEDQLKIQRELLHKQLLLDVVTPVFRRVNRYVFKNEDNSNGPLINPHEGVKPTDNGGVIALIRGKYEYYHYCQNNMDDNGWGCAYRSLQTIASWYKLQGYVENEVPSFKDIQKCLVDIGDKQTSFIGSKQWIGSMEVNFVLSTLLGITCKILYVSSGEEMSSKGPELVNHFVNHGSPIMIGGGVLAHTILGVDYNQQLGTIRFLILDPHYTGSEDLRTIQTKGWCGWKNVDFWNKSAYYNMCLPQVSKDI